MFERFTDRARRVVVLAQEEARLLDHNYIGTEHILLGLIHEGEGVGARALEVCNVSIVEVRTRVEAIIGRGANAPSGHIPFTPRAKKVLELALREALQLGHNYIGTEHILLGLLREGEGVGAKVLTEMGVGLLHVRQVVTDLLAGVTPTEPAARAEVESSFRGVTPATCSFCGVASPVCGALFTGRTGALICESCLRTGVQRLNVEGTTSVQRDPEAAETTEPPDAAGDEPPTA